VYSHAITQCAYISHAYNNKYAQVASESAAEFEKLWEAGKGLKGWTWTAATSTSTASNKTGRTLDLSMYYSAEDLKPLGMERLKEALEVIEMLLCEIILKVIALQSM
jgi:Replication stress response SDE2 C-terminal